jgi:adenylosuccinate lyase
MIGRSHGIHAEPNTFGLKMALFYAEMGRNRDRLLKARETIACGKISGAVGTFANISPDIEAAACASWASNGSGLHQIIQRDRHAEFFTTLAVVAATWKSWP